MLIEQSLRFRGTNINVKALDMIPLSSAIFFQCTIDHQTWNIKYEIKEKLET
jgi:hypothetical protein